MSDSPPPIGCAPTCARPRSTVLAVALAFACACACAKSEAPPAASSAPTPATASAAPMTPPTASTTAASSAPPAASSAPAAARDEIDRVVARLAASPMWNNGGFPKIALPASASNDALVTAAFARISFDEGKVTKHTIVTARRVRIGDDDRPYTAAIVDTNLGRKVVLLRYEGEKVGWWSRVFDEA